MTKRTIVLTFLIFIFALSARCYWFSHKQGFHTDEIFTVVISKNNEYGFTKYFDTEKIYTGKEVKELVFGINDNSPKEIINSLKSLRFHNNGDTPNTPLYYSLFRISQIGLNSTEIKDVFQRGFYLNLILFSLSFFFMFKLLNILNFEKKYIPIILGFCYLNTGTISISIFARYYALQETAFIILAYVFAVIYKSEKINTLKNFLKITFAVAFTLLSGYYGIIYSGILGIILLIKKRPFWFLLCSIAAAFLLTFLIYPNYLDFIYAPRVNLFDNSLLLNITHHLHLIFVVSILFNYLFYIIALFILFLILLLNKKLLKDNILWILISVSFICYILFFLFAPQKVMRYTEPVFPIISLIIPAIIIPCKNYKNILIIMLFLFYAAIASFPTKYESYDSNLNPPRVSLKRGNLENLFVNTKCSPVENSSVPILIVEERGWNVLNTIPYLKDNQEIKFSYSDEPELFDGKSILLVTERSLILPNKISIEKEFSCQRFNGYIIERK
ncbi:hypothetical protein IJ818_06855 [bacterium]|nr:hypothetical protein [bacterium]